MEQVLSLVGAGALTLSMLGESSMMLSLMQDIDFDKGLAKVFDIRQEYCFRGKNRLGFKTRSYKMTANKFLLEVEKPELLEDWDKRYDCKYIHV